MTKIVTLRDANQNFAKYLREVEGGEEIVVTRRGEPVAKIVPMPGKKRVLTAGQQEALKRLFEMSEKGYRSDGPLPSRDELYDEILEERLAVYRR
jgi:prevent-host-death family protein